MPKRELGLDSVQASALMMSDGYTDDPVEALNYDAEFNDDLMDATMRKKLRNAMGFDFVVKMRGNTLTVYSKTLKDRVRAKTHINPGDRDKYGNIVSPELISRLVHACMEMKTKWDALRVDYDEVTR